MGIDSVHEYNMETPDLRSLFGNTIDSSTSEYGSMEDEMLCGSSLKRLRKCSRQLSPPMYASESLDDRSCPNTPSLTPRCGDRRTESVPTYATVPPRSMPLSPPSVDVNNKGQLKLAITASQDRLDLHVIEAQFLKSKWNDTTSSYVEMSLLSEGKKDIRCQSKTVFSTDQPTFDEKFSFDVMANDDKKRLKVAMYNKEGKENCNELLGCMTFGVKHLLSRKKQVNGWYYLLPEDVGRRKHLQASPRRQKERVVKSSSKDSNVSKSSSIYGSSIPLVNKSLQGLETITIVVKRGRHGYGFSVVGSSPVCIGTVEEGSHAESAGLVKGDSVVRINGQNVSRSTADSVAKIVKGSLKQIILDVVRQQAASSSCSSSVYEGLSSNATSYENLPYYASSQSSSLSSSSRRKQQTPSLSSRPSPIGATPARGVNDTLPLRPSQAENTPASHSRKSHRSHRSSSSSNCSSSRKKSRCSPSSSAKSRRSIVSSASSQLQIPASAYPSLVSDSDYDSVSPLNNTVVESYAGSYDELPWGEDEDIYFPQNSEIYDALPWKPFDCDLNKSRRHEDETYQTMCSGKDKTEESIRDCSDETFVADAEYAHTTLPDLSVSFCDLSHQEQARQAAIQHLILLEANYISQMQYGIQRYSRPLRHCILSAREHRILFQNVEKIVAFSEYHMRQLTKHSQTYADVNISDVEQGYIDFVGSVFCPKVPLTCDAYERYNDGLTESLKLLSDLKTYEQFYEFLNSPEATGTQPSIEEFLQKPGEHLHAATLTLRTILSHTPREHQDAEALKLVVEAFTNCLENLNGETSEETMVNESITSVASKNSSSGSRSSSGSKSSAASIDSQVLEIQERLVFPKDIPVFQVAAPSRHMIFSGELLRVESCMWSKVFVILFSDLLLVTRVEGDDLVVVDQPLLLPDIITSEFGKDHAHEFTLTAEVRSSLHSGWEPRHLLFRSSGMEQHCTWKSLLEQRISSFKAHRELMTGRSHEIMF